MERLKNAFNPIYFDSDHICKMVKECGFKYIVLTAKHHEGFTLFDSKVSEFTIMHTPFKRDIIKELAELCKKYNLKLGLYYLQILDWNEFNGGGYNFDPSGSCGDSYANEWDYPNNKDKDFNRCFKNKMLPQIKELMTNYGEIFLAWFDMCMDSTKEQSEVIYRLVKKYQPHCLVNSRLGNGIFDYDSLGDNVVPEDENSDCLNNPKVVKLHESACTINDTWGYSAHDLNFKSPEEIVKTRLHLEKLGVNYLVNVGPDWLGRIPYQTEEILRKVQELYLLEKSK